MQTWHFVEIFIQIGLRNLFIWEPTFLRKHGKSSFDVFAVQSSKRFFKASFRTEFDFKGKYFYLKTWCVVKMLIHNLTHFKKVNSKTDESWKKLVDWHTRIKVFAFKICFFSCLFSQIHSHEKAQNCQIWRF